MKLSERIRRSPDIGDWRDDVANEVAKLEAVAEAAKRYFVLPPDKPLEKTEHLLLRTELAHALAALEAEDD